MRLKLLFIFSIFLSANLFSQVPPNDDCSGAINIPLGTPPPCGVGTQVGAISTVVGDITNATPGSPYIYQNNCSGAGGPNQGVQANDVWYSFTATGYQAIMTINSTFANPNISFYAGTCAALGGGIGGCAVGVGGVVTLTVNQCVPGTSYMLQISGNPGQTGTFTMNINNTIDCMDCLVSSALTANPLPVNGTYAPGQTVNFCLKINSYKTINTNWLHGVQLNVGSGWDASSIIPNTPVPIGAAGTWSYYPAGIGVVNAVNWGPGWYFDWTPNDGPQNNFGDNICGAVPNCVDLATPAQWNFCFDITTNPVCSPGSNLSVTFNTSGDGESGSWTNAGCASDAAINFNAIGKCCPPNMIASAALCSGGASGSATATPVGTTGPYTYNWTGPGGFTSTSSNVVGPNSISNIGSGVYSLTIIDNNLCSATATVAVTVNAPPTLTVSGSTVCDGANAQLSASGGVNYSWTGPNGFSSGVQNPVVANASTLSVGVYTVLVTAATGCTNTATAIVNVNIPLTPSAISNGPLCLGSVLSLTASGASTYTWAGPNNFASTLITPTIATTTTLTGGFYTLTAMDQNGCVGATQHFVIVNPLPPLTFTAGNKGCAPICVTFSAASTTSIQNFVWNLDNGGVLSGTSNISYACYTKGGTHTISVSGTDMNGCVSIMSSTIEVYPKPNANFYFSPEKPIVNNSSEVAFFDQTTGAPIIQWNWYFTNTNEFQSSAPNPIFVYKEAGDYIVSMVVKSNRGCADTVLKKIIVGEDFGIFIPNAFTPNDDGLNDIFQPKGFGITKYDLEIFDRWGEKIFTSNNFNVGWDGMYNGKMSQDDVYQWKIKVTNVYGHLKEYIGHVTLIK